MNINGSTDSERKAMIQTVDEASASISPTNRGLVSDALWNRLTNRIVKDEGVDLALAERIMDQTLGFLVLCAKEPNRRYSPSPLVDIGWHIFILYTREYARFCEKVAGRFIHHVPADEVGVDYGTGNITRTVAAMRVRGMKVDEELWSGSEGICNRCLETSCADG